MYKLRFHHWFSWGILCNSCANTSGIPEIPQENFRQNSQSHRVQRNFSAGFTMFLLYGELSSRKWFAERNKEKKRPDGNHRAKRLILPRSLPAFLDILIFVVSWSTRWDTRSICVACIFHGTNGSRATIADISADLYRSYKTIGNIEDFLRTPKKPEGGLEWRVEGETGSLLWAQPLARRYYTTGLNIAWKRRNIIRNKSLFVAILD